MIYATVPPQFCFNCNQTNKLHYYNFDQKFLLVEKAIFHAYSLERRLLIIIC